MLTVPFAVRALTDPIDRSAARAYAQRVRPTYPADLYPGGQWREMLAPIALLMSSVGVLVAGFLWVTDAAVPIIGGWILLVWVLIPVSLGFAIAAARRRLAGRWFRLQQFANANRLQFTPASPGGARGRSGSKFTVGGARVDVLNVVSAPGTRNLMVGTLRVETGSAKQKTVAVTEFVRMSLSRHLPHIVLDAKSNNGMGQNGRLGAEFDRHQRLSLEGNFDDDFTLYCPAGYEADALYLFTPDIMARMQDHAADWDVEIIDDELYLYSPRRSLGTNPQRWQELGTTVNALVQKLDQWERWSESRGAAPIDRLGRADRTFVAYEGRRLKQRFPWWMWIAIPAGLALAIFGVVQLGIDIVAGISDLLRMLFG